VVSDRRARHPDSFCWHASRHARREASLSDEHHAHVSAALRRWPVVVITWSTRRPRRCASGKAVANTASALVGRLRVRHLATAGLGGEHEVVEDVPVGHRRPVDTLRTMERMASLQSRTTAEGSTAASPSSASSASAQAASTAAALATPTSPALSNFVNSSRSSWDFALKVGQVQLIVGTRGTRGSSVRLHPEWWSCHIASRGWFVRDDCARDAPPAGPHAASHCKRSSRIIVSIVVVLVVTYHRQSRIIVIASRMMCPRPPPSPQRPRPPHRSSSSSSPGGDDTSSSALPMPPPLPADRHQVAAMAATALAAAAPARPPIQNAMVRPSLRPTLATPAIRAYPRTMMATELRR